MTDIIDDIFDAIESQLRASAPDDSFHIELTNSQWIELRRHHQVWQYLVAMRLGEPTIRIAGTDIARAGSRDADHFRALGRTAVNIRSNK